jgi:hypothetical protein
LFDDQHNLHKGRRGLGTLHIPNTLSAMLWECTLVASICWLLSHLHCTVDAGTLASGLWALAKVMDVEQSHAEMFDACWACISLLAHAHWHMGGAAHAG